MQFSRCYRLSVQEQINCLSSLKNQENKAHCEDKKMTSYDAVKEMALHVYGKAHARLDDLNRLVERPIVHGTMDMDAKEVEDEVCALNCPRAFLPRTKRQ